MPLPLREPFFLKGRTSVVQRAVIMSAVLGGMECAVAYHIANIAPAVIRPPTFDLEKRALST